MEPENVFLVITLLPQYVPKWVVTGYPWQWHIILLPKILIVPYWLRCSSNLAHNDDLHVILNLNSEDGANRWITQSHT